VIAVVTPEEMAAIDRQAPEPLEVLVERAGAATARAAVKLLGGTYGRRVVVVAGKGHNGDDGRAAAARLAARGVQVRVIDAAEVPESAPPCDLLVDAAYGTGFHGEWTGPWPGRAKVLAVDIPSGVDGLTGAAGPGVVAADHTVTFAALKPGLVFSPGSLLAGTLEVADIGLDVSSARTHLVQQADVASWLPLRPADAHKWRSALWVVAGSAGMLGSAHLASTAAQRAGAGMVHLSSPGIGFDPLMPTEVVGRPLPAKFWDGEALAAADRFHACVVGPGLGRADETVASVRGFVARSALPLVVDGDGLFALAWGTDGARSVLADRGESPTVLTPHDGEYALLTGQRPSRDRIDAARRLAAQVGAVVLLKGPATVVAEPGGRALVVTAGDERLATAGTGDVLAGIIGAFLAQGLPGFAAAAAGAWVHGQAGRLGPARGLVAGDLPGRVPQVLESLG
jgi:ADP-dependent NAD(P)H-hydrate dehydratase / NAD(P)H-hydrate epimerase